MKGSVMNRHAISLLIRNVFSGSVLLLLLAASLAPGYAADTLVVREAVGVAMPWRTPVTVISPTPLQSWLSADPPRSPEHGERVRLPDGSEVAWQRVVADSLGWFGNDPPAYRFLAVTINSKAPARVILEGMGHDIVYVNGTPRSGNPYQQKEEREAWEPRFDYSHVPIELREGQNILMFGYARGRLKIRLYESTRPVRFNANDLTLPDAIVGKELEAWGSIVVVNTTDAPLRNYFLASSPAGGTPDTVAVPGVPQVGVRKAGFKIRLAPRPAKGEVPVLLSLLADVGGRKLMVDTVTIPIRVVGSEEMRKETFISSTDGSVQYYAVMPQQPGRFTGKPALFLSLHGAGVEAYNQAGSYAPKGWGTVVAATNRRPYGFSWEDWGRLDALEVLETVKEKYGFDEDRIYLTGHSMGGHGTWFMGATYPDKFAAIGPSAGWITFTSYRFRGALEVSSGVQQMLRRAAAPSDLFSLVDNYRHFGIYILHGDKDDNVPPQQSYMMIEKLKPIHKDFEYFEQPGAGHWWDNSPGPGADCVDWRPMFDFFARHARAGIDRIRTVEFTTANPGISARDYWVTIDAQERQLTLSTARLQLDPGLNEVKGTTTNVARLAIDRGVLTSVRSASVELDSQTIAIRHDVSSGDRVWFEKEHGKWHQSEAPSTSLKGAHRYGTFKEAFRNRMALVYGTSGSPEENRWAFERARFDAEKLWYQGNGSADVIADTEFDPSKEPDRNIILYGNSETNRLWDRLLSDSPVQVKRNRVTIDGKSMAGSDICCFLVRPKPGSASASVGAISGTGVEGMKLSHMVRYLEPGLGLPDVTVFNADVLTKGDAGILLAGFFGLDWGMGTGEFVGGKR